MISRMNILLRRLAVLLLASASCTLSAQEARSTKWVNLRAGPARDYPLVTPLAPGTPLQVDGCTPDFRWCDVVAPGGMHGWVYAGNLSYPYQNQEVPILGYGAMIGFPIAGFVIGDYWGEYYRDRPWFGNQSRWEHHVAPGGTGRRGNGVGGPPGERGGQGRPLERGMMPPQPQGGTVGGTPARMPARPQGGPPPGMPARPQGNAAPRNEGHPQGGGQPREAGRAQGNNGPGPGGHP